MSAPYSPGHEATPHSLLDRILATPLFRQAPLHSAVLGVICHHTQAGHFEELHEHDIGVAALGLKPGYNVRENDAVTRITAEIREMLKLYFQREGRREILRLVIPPGEFRAFFYEAAPDEIGPPEQSVLDLFWEPYLRGAGTNLLVHSELSGGAMPIPEAYALVRIAAFFESRKAELDIRPASSLEASDLSFVHLILLGQADHNPLIARFSPSPKSEATVIREWQRLDHGVLTILTGPESLAVQRVAMLITGESQLRAAMEKHSDRFPPDFTLTLA